MRKILFKNGDRIGLLTAVESVGMDDKGKTLWKFICECGSSHIRPGAVIKKYEKQIREGKKEYCSCGCLKRKGKSNNKWCGHKGLYGATYGHYKHHAAKRMIEFKVSIEYLWNVFEKQNRKCPYTGYDLDLTIRLNYSNSKMPANASLDRIDSSKGYVEGNIQWVFKPINNMKGEMSHNEFLKMCKLITENWK